MKCLGSARPSNPPAWYANLSSPGRALGRAFIRLHIWQLRLHFPSFRGWAVSWIYSSSEWTVLPHQQSASKTRRRWRSQMLKSSKATKLNSLNNVHGCHAVSKNHLPSQQPWQPVRWPLTHLSSEGGWIVKGWLSSPFPEAEGDPDAWGGLFQRPLEPPAASERMSSPPCSAILPSFPPCWLSGKEAAC